jgi:hypothetical protein
MREQESWMAMKSLNTLKKKRKRKKKMVAKK